MVGGLKSALNPRSFKIIHFDTLQYIWKSLMNISVKNQILWSSKIYGSLQKRGVISNQTPSSFCNSVPLCQTTRMAQKKVCMYLCQDNEKARNDSNVNKSGYFSRNDIKWRISGVPSQGSLGNIGDLMEKAPVVGCELSSRLATILKRVTIHLVKPYRVAFPALKAIKRWT